MRVWARKRETVRSSADPNMTEPPRSTGWTHLSFSGVDFRWRRHNNAIVPATAAVATATTVVGAAILALGARTIDPSMVNKEKQEAAMSRFVVAQFAGKDLVAVPSHPPPPLSRNHFVLFLSRTRNPQTSLTDPVSICKLMIRFRIRFVWLSHISVTSLPQSCHV